ncbi:MAG: flagellin fliC [Rickettsiaceae bacterium]|jgi:hypothetical protein|nr:flagellin fliC [Rickettsiaceae bacterium]
MPENNQSTKILSYNVFGVVMDHILKPIRGMKPNASFTMVNNPTTDDYININGKMFNFVSTVYDQESEILIGDNLTATVKNTVKTLNKSSDSRVMVADYNSNQAKSQIIATYKFRGTKAEHNFTLSCRNDSTSIIINDSELTGGSPLTGIDLSKLQNNDKFIGRIQGFSAIFNSDNQVNLEITVGDYTYRATNINTDPKADTWITLEDIDNGGFFRIQLSGFMGVRVKDQASADLFATKLNKSFSSLTFTQTREISILQTAEDIFDGQSRIGSLNDATILLTSDNFDEVKIESVKFRAPNADKIKKIKTGIVNKNPIHHDFSEVIYNKIQNLKVPDQQIADNIKGTVSKLNNTSEDILSHIKTEFAKPEMSTKDIVANVVANIEILKIEQQNNLEKAKADIEKLKSKVNADFMQHEKLLTVSNADERVQDINKEENIVEEPILISNVSVESEVDTYIETSASAELEDPEISLITQEIENLSSNNKQMIDSVATELSSLLEAEEEQKDAQIIITIDGKKYTSSSGIGSKFDYGSLIKLTNNNESNKFIVLRVGSHDLDLSTTSKAKSVKAAFNKSLSLTELFEEVVDESVSIAPPTDVEILKVTGVNMQENDSI